ncbi:MAG TPA: HAD family hydrolase [Chroococcales cyanobacterium]
MKVRCVIFDLDGTLCDCRHRLQFVRRHPKDWKSFFQPERVFRDPPHEDIVELAKTLAKSYALIIVTGRPDSLYEVSRDWLQQHEIPAAKIYMRQQGDHRKDTEVKEEILEQIEFDQYEPFLVVDDRKAVVEMWRENGLTCLQVAEGDY